MAVAALLASPASAAAHDGRAIAPHDLWQSWSFAPLVILALAASVCCYALGTRAIWRRAGRARGVSSVQVAAFAGGIAAVIIALVSPLDAASGSLFAAHMTQHMLLVVVAAPLFVIARPSYVMLFALPPRARRRLARAWRATPALRAGWRALTIPLLAWLLHAVALWLWHVPTLYDAALRNPGMHAAEHASFMITAVVFWWVALDRHRLGVGAATLFLFAAALQCTLLGALLALARHPWYVGHYGTTQPWGLSPLEDQQLAGLIMWIPAGLAYLVALLPRVVAALREERPAQHAVACPATAPGAL